MNSVTLEGCRPIPLAAYLKGLGVFRLVAEQADPHVRCFWLRDQLVLRTSLSKARLEAFFLNDYRPSPILAPWNSGSGFYPKDKDCALKMLESAEAERFSGYRSCLSDARKNVVLLGLKEKPGKLAKQRLLEHLRNVMHEEALDWLDAAYVLADAGPKFPPLLGTGGNDGRLEFTNNFMQRLTELLSPRTGTPTNRAATWLRATLFDETVADLGKAPIGQFDPNGAGGANASTGFDSPSLVNPWDYVLMIEGTLLFAVASAKRLESSAQGQLAYPFCVRQAGVGYASESLVDEKSARAEMWMPLWERPVSLPELRAVLNEGRAQVSGRSARNGVDFARAVASLGVDRGLSQFQRFGFLVRNGKAYFATPLDRLPVQRNRSVRLLEEVDPWLDGFRSKATSDNLAPPAGVARALRRLENSIFRFCQLEDPARVQDVLCALGNCQRVLSRSLRWTRKIAYLQPLQGLSADWLQHADTGSRELRLATAVASTTLWAGKQLRPFRYFLESVELKGSKQRHRYSWREENLRDTAWIESNVVGALNAITGRQLVGVQKAGTELYRVSARKTAPLSDIAAFLEEAIDETLFTELLWGLSLIDWMGMETVPDLIPEDSNIAPDALYALLKLCFAGSKVQDVAIPVTPAIHVRASHGDATDATRLAVRRLRASGLAPAIELLPASPYHIRRAAAALLIPIASTAIGHLAGQVLTAAARDRTSETSDSDRTLESLSLGSA